MSCEFIRDENGKVLAIVCGSPWGIGVYTMPGWDDPIYGVPPKSMNPHDFSPDYECCTEAEDDAARGKS